MRTSRVLITALMIVIAAAYLQAQQPNSAKALQFPESVALADAEIRWQSGGGDGCAGYCTYYRITIRGDGLVTLEDLGWGGRPPAEPIRQRRVAVDSVVKLMDEFFAARFFEGAGNFENRHTAVRKGDLLFVYSRGGIGAGWVDLTLRLGPLSKTARLGTETPTDLVRLKDRIWEIGGPKTAWPVP
jgi:hypothetical protein